MHWKLIIVMILVLASCDAQVEKGSSLEIQLKLNTTKPLSPSETIELKFTITSLNSSSNISFEVNFLTPNIHLLEVKNHGASNTGSLQQKNQSLSWIITQMNNAEQRTITAIAKTSNSLPSQVKIPFEYNIQYYVDAVNSSSSLIKATHSKDLLSYTKAPYLHSVISITPNKVEGGDIANATIILVSKYKFTDAHNLSITASLASSIIDNAYCTYNNTRLSAQRTANSTVMLFLEFLRANEPVSCNFTAKIRYNISLGGALPFKVFLSYYHTQPDTYSYPIKDSFTKNLTVLPITGKITASKNLSALLAGDIFRLDVSLFIPRSLSLIDVIINLPIYKVSTRAKRSVGLVSQDVLTAEATKENNLTYTVGSAVTISKIPIIQTISNETLKIDFGLVNSGAASKSNANASSLKLKIWFKVRNDPVNLSGRKAEFLFVIGDTNLKTPIQVVGPILRPDLTIQKHAKILDPSRDSPSLQFTVVIRHATGSPIDAASLIIIDRIDNIVHYTNNIKPAGKVDVTTDYLKGSVLIRATVQSLPVSENVTLVYQGAFMKDVLAPQSRQKASFTWRSPQINSPLFGPLYSQETCLVSKQNIITKTEKSYTMVILGIVVGIVAGILVGLLILYCMRKTGVVKTYVFLDIMEDEENEEENKQQARKDAKQPSRLNFMNSVRQKGQKGSTQPQKLDEANWALMIAAKYEKDAIERARCRTLIEELIRGYETSFKFFVDGLSQVVLLFSAKLRSEGDISAEDLRKVQQGAATVMTNYDSKSKVVDHQLIKTTGDLAAVGKEYLKHQCSLLMTAEKESTTLFLSMIPPNLKKDKAQEDKIKEMKGDFEELKRVLFTQSHDIRAQTFVNVRGVDITRSGHVNILIWSEKVVSLWCKWMMKKLLRELDILHRRRAVTDEDSRSLIENITEIFNQVEKAIKEELCKRAVAVQRELVFDCWGLFKAMENNMQAELKNIENQGSQQASRSIKDTLEYIKTRFELFGSYIKDFLEKTDYHQVQMFQRTLGMIKEVRSSHIKDMIGKLELAVIKHFSKASASDDKEVNSNQSDVSNEDDHDNHKPKEEGMKSMLECLEDIQADYSEVETEDNSLLNDFLEEIQATSADITAMVTAATENAESLVEDPITHSRFLLKSLLYALRDMSHPKAKSLLEDWSNCLQLTITEMYIRHDLDTFTKIKAESKTAPESEENVIFWFKSVDSITEGEFVKSKYQFRDFVVSQRKHLEGLFDEQTEHLKTIAKDFILRDLQEDEVYIRKISSLKTEFLISHQFVIKILRLLDDKQHLSDPEVKECFVKFDKAIRILADGQEQTEELETPKLAKKDEIADLLSNFREHCDLLQPQPQVGTSVKIDQLMFDEEAIADKIILMIDARQKQDFRISTLEKMHFENVQLIASLRKLDTIPESAIMELVKVLFFNVPKHRLDAVMAAIDGESKRSYCEDLSRYLSTENAQDENVEEDYPQEQKVAKRNKKKKKSNILKKNIVGPEP